MKNKSALFFALAFIRFKWWLLRPYYEGLLIQARFLYRQSDLYRIRRNELGIDFAEESFGGDVDHFFRKAKYEPISVRAMIFWDAFLGREPRPYYL